MKDTIYCPYCDSQYAPGDMPRHLSDAHRYEYNYWDAMRRGLSKAVAYKAMALVAAKALAEILE